MRCKDGCASVPDGVCAVLESYVDEALGRVIGGGRGHGHPHRLALHEKHIAWKGGLCGGAVRTGVWGWGTGKGGVFVFVETSRLFVGKGVWGGGGFVPG
jgi:hypothetical protein